MNKNRFLIFVLVVTMVFSMVIQGNACPIPNLTYTNSEWDIVDGYLYGIREGQVSDTVIADFYYSENMIASSDVIGTGSTLSYVDADGNVTESVTVVVFGDLNGDGKVTSADYMMLKKGVTNSSLLSELGFKAGDVTGDGKLAAADYMYVKRHIQGRLDLYGTATVPTPIPTEEPELISNGTLIVNGKDITEGNYVYFTGGGVISTYVPFVAVLEALGAELEDVGSEWCDFYFNDTFYSAQLSSLADMTLEIMVYEDGCVTNYEIYRTSFDVENEFIVEASSMEAFLNANNAKIEIDIKNNIVNIYSVE